MSIMLIIKLIICSAVLAYILSIGLCATICYRRVESSRLIAIQMVCSIAWEYGSISALTAVPKALHSMFFISFIFEWL